MSVDRVEANERLCRDYCMHASTSVLLEEFLKDGLPNRHGKIPPYVVLCAKWVKRQYRKPRKLRKKELYDCCRVAWPDTVGLQCY